MTNWSRFPLRALHTGWVVVNKGFHSHLHLTDIGFRCHINTVVDLYKTFRSVPHGIILECSTSIGSRALCSRLFQAHPTGGRPQEIPRTCWRDHVCQVGASWNHSEKSGCIYRVREVRALLLRLLPLQLSRISGWRSDATIFTLQHGSTDRIDWNRPQLSLFLKNTIPWQ